MATKKKKCGSKPATGTSMGEQRDAPTAWDQMVRGIGITAIAQAVEDVENNERGRSAKSADVATPDAAPGQWGDPRCTCSYFDLDVMVEHSIGCPARPPNSTASPTGRTLIEKPALQNIKPNHRRFVEYARDYAEVGITGVSATATAEQIVSWKNAGLDFFPFTSTKRPYGGYKFHQRVIRPHGPLQRLWVPEQVRRLVRMLATEDDAAWRYKIVPLFLHFNAGPFTLSVQASATHYCSPRVDGLQVEEYDSFEVQWGLTGLYNNDAAQVWLWPELSLEDFEPYFPPDLFRYFKEAGEDQLSRVAAADLEEIIDRLDLYGNDIVENARMRTKQP